MSIFKVGKIWRYDFVRGGHRFQGSTKQTNVNKARDVEAKLKSDIALGTFGIAPLRETPIFADYMNDTFLGHVGRHAKTRHTYDFYRDKTKRILKFEPWETLRLSQIDGNQINKYVAWASRGVAIHTVNNDIRTLRKALRLAEELGLIKKAPRVRSLPGEKSRDFVISAELEAQYLAIAPYPLKQAVTLMLDCGLRPEECVQIRKMDIADCSIHVATGKSHNAARTLPITSRVEGLIDLVFALFPSSEWLFPGKKGGHYRRKSLDDAHLRFVRKNGFPREFVLHSCRHTYATRLAESGANQWEIMALLGHADIRMSSKYIHPQTDSLRLAARRKEELDKIRRGEVAQQERPLSIDAEAND